jgi:hypothetical protein
MYYPETQQTHQQWGAINPQQQGAQFGLQGVQQGPGQAAFGQFGQPQQFGNAQQSYGWSQTRQLSQQDVGDVVRQLVPLLPQILAQAQQQPQAAYGWPQQRQLSPQDVTEVVRQILPIVPQIVGLLQGQPQMGQQAYGQQACGQFGAQQHNPFAQQHQNPFAMTPVGLQQGLPQMQAAFGAHANLQQRQLSQQDVNEVVQQLLTVIPQVIGGLQAASQQRI